MYVKTAVILSTIVASYYGAFYACTSLQSCIAFAVLLGIGMGEVGVSIMHDANHGAYCTVPWITWLMSTTLDMVGASSFMWRQQHVAGHHVHTNVEDKDPDIRVSDPDVRRVTPKQPWQPYHVRGSINTCHSLPMCAQQRQQHLYLAALYGLLSIKSVLVDDFSALAKGCIGPVRLSTMVWHESLIFWGGKLLFAVWFVVLPLLYSPHGVGRLLVLWLTCQLCIGWMLAFMFQVRWYQLLHFTESCTNAGCARDGRRRVSQARPEQGQCGHGGGQKRRWPRLPTLHMAHGFGRISAAASTTRSSTTCFQASTTPTTPRWRPSCRKRAASLVCHTQCTPHSGQRWVRTLSTCTPSA